MQHRLESVGVSVYEHTRHAWIRTIETPSMIEKSISLLSRFSSSSNSGSHFSKYVSKWRHLTRLDELVLSFPVENSALASLKTLQSGEYVCRF